MFTNCHRLATAFFSFAIAACSSGEGRVSLWLTDAPGDGVRSAVVTIDRIYLQGESETEDGDRIVLLDTPVTTDLVELANTADLLVDDHVVPAGIYGQLRLVISGAAVSVERDGSLEVWSTPGYAELPAGEVAGDLTIPSWSSSGFKVKLPGGSIAVEGTQRVLLVDFDVAESVGQQTGNNKLVMRPVIDAIDLGLSAGIDVRVDLGDTDPALLAGTTAILRDAEGNIEGNEPLAIDAAAGVAAVEFKFLRPDEGPFSLSLDPENADALLTSPALPMQIDVSSGAVETVELSITGAVSE